MMSPLLDSACQSQIQIQVKPGLFGKMSPANLCNIDKLIITSEREHTLGVFINRL